MLSFLPMAETEPGKRNQKVDKLVKGILIGGALGSLVGATVAGIGKKKKNEISSSSVEKPKKKGMVSSFVRGMKVLIKGKK